MITLDSIEQIAYDTSDMMLFNAISRIRETYMKWFNNRKISLEDIKNFYLAKSAVYERQADASSNPNAYKRYYKKSRIALNLALNL